jgi:predicted dehydrogenase
MRGSCSRRISRTLAQVSDPFQSIARCDPATWLDLAGESFIKFLAPSAALRKSTLPDPEVGFATIFVLKCMASYVNPRPQNNFRVQRPKGRIKINNAYAYRDLECVTSRGRVAYSQHPPIRQQTMQMDDFARCILEDRPSRVPGEMGLRDMKIIAAIYEATNSGKSVELKA